ncbi:MAG: prepilin-type N-terminal cleavage/methylation domain-containing protein [Pyrinomonadaceae bacterium]
MNTLNKQKNKNQKGFGLAELVVVLLILAIIIVLALPQLISSRRLFRFSGLQRQISATLRDTRQEAMSQRTAITLRYDDTNKTMIVYGGSFGALGDAKNPIMPMSGDGLTADEIVYGRPAGAPVAALGDGSNLTALSSNAVEIVYQPDGSVINSSNIPQNRALFFYDPKTPADTAFAVSVLGAGGRVKIWRYSSGVNAYVE